MNKTVIAVVGVAGALALWLVPSYYGAYNYGADAETQIETRYQNMENVLGQYSLKVAEVAQVPGMMTEDLSTVVREAMTGRYGEDGSGATFQWIQENYPGQVDASLYKQIQQVMEAGRNQFQNEQTLFLEVKRPYLATLKKDLLFSRGWWLGMQGYPKIDLDEYVIISSGHAQQAFDNKVDSAIQLRGGTKTGKGF